MINYKDPRFQQLLLQKAAKSPWTAPRNAEAETAAWAGAQQRELLKQGEYGLLSEMNRAKIKDLAFRNKMAESRLGLERGYFGLEERGLGLKEREMGVREQEMGLRSKFQGLSEREGSWRNRQFMRDLADRESALNLSTWLGLGQAAWGGYEGHRRAQLTEEDRKKQAKWDAVFEQLLARQNGSTP